MLKPTQRFNQVVDSIVEWDKVTSQTLFCETETWLWNNFTYVCYAVPILKS